jgi:hypothetical protein
MNKGILCGKCNEKFSALDSLLESQFAFLNGAIGVRPDHAEAPKLVTGSSASGPIAFDHTGTPTLPGPRTESEEVRPDGRRWVRTRFANEKQVQQWFAGQKAAGLDVRVISREAHRSFVLDPIVVTWTFGGDEAFREVGRIALNFLAHKWPDHARAANLRPFKDFVEGTCLPAANEPRFVWYAPADVPEIQTSPFAFGHQVLVVLESERAYARVRFFSTFDLCVAFGPLTTSEPSAAIFDIDPHAARPPDDLRESAPTTLPGWVVPPTADGVTSLEELVSVRLQTLLEQVAARQWATYTEGLLESINAVVALPQGDRPAAIRGLLDPYIGLVLQLGRNAAHDFRRRFASDELGSTAADSLDSMLAIDDLATDGLTPVARTVLRLAMSGLALAISSELDVSSLTRERLWTWLSGGAGTRAVGSVLIDLLMRAMETARELGQGEKVDQS